MYKKTEKNARFLQPLIHSYLVTLAKVTKNATQEIV